MFTRKLASLTPVDFSRSTPAVTRKPAKKKAQTVSAFVAAGKKISNPPYQLVNAYAAYSTNDNGFKDKLIGYFTDFGLAYAAARGQGSWGGQGITETKRALIIDKRYFILEHESPVMNKTNDEFLREKALSKLTLADKKLLKLV